MSDITRSRRPASLREPRATHALRSARDRHARRRDQRRSPSPRPVTRCGRACATARRQPRRRSSRTSHPPTRSRAATRRASPTSPPRAAARSTAAARRPAAARRSRRRRIRAPRATTSHAAWRSRCRPATATSAARSRSATAATPRSRSSTNATGVATGLNADRVDGKNAEDIAQGRGRRDRRRCVRSRSTATGSRAKTRGVVTTNGVTNPSGAGHVRRHIRRRSERVRDVGDAHRHHARPDHRQPDASRPTRRRPAVDVRTFNGTGVAADRGFHLSAIC